MGELITFTDLSADEDGTVVAWHWDFGDGTTDTVQNPTHAYAARGRYFVSLVVSDDVGARSTVATGVVLINKQPVADAGEDQVSLVGEAVRLDGSASSDADDDELAYSWRVAVKPAGSTPVLTDASTPTPTFTADVAGSYVVELVVNDGIEDSEPDTVTITVTNRPVAVAGPDRYGAVNSPILLDGSASYDPDEGESVTDYEWTVVDRPVGAVAEIQPLAEPAAKVHLLVDRPGEYRVRLVVTDSVGEESEPDEVRVVVVQTYVAPNPARHEATFYYDADLAGGTLRIFNVAGRLVRTLALEADGSTTWDLTDAGGRPLASGLYLWVLLDQDGRPVTERPERLVIQR